MNTSFDPLRLVNTYGAFGSVGRVRDEIVIEALSLSPPARALARARAAPARHRPGLPRAASASRLARRLPQGSPSPFPLPPLPY